MFKRTTYAKLVKEVKMKKPVKLTDLVFEKNSKNKKEYIQEMNLNEGIWDFFKNIGSFLKKAWEPAWSEKFDEALFKEKGIVAPKTVGEKPFEELGKSEKEQWIEQIQILMQTVQKASKSAEDIKKAMEAFAEKAQEGKSPEEAVKDSLDDLGISADEGEVGTKKAAERMEKGLSKMTDQSKRHFERAFELVRDVESAEQLINWFVELFPDEKKSFVKKALRKEIKEI
jgi:hypothetical protein